MFFIFLLALIIFGPKKLPEIGRQIGKALAEFKRYSNDFKYQLESEVRQWEIESTLQKEKETLKEAISLPEGTIPSLGLDESLESLAAPLPVPAVEATPPENPVVEDANSICPPATEAKEPNA